MSGYMPRVPIVVVSLCIVSNVKQDLSYFCTREECLKTWYLDCCAQYDDGKAHLWILALADQRNKECAVLICRLISPATLLCVCILHPGGRWHMHVEIQRWHWEHSSCIRRSCIRSCCYRRSVACSGVIGWCGITTGCRGVRRWCCTRRGVWVHRCIWGLALLSKLRSFCCSCCCSCTTTIAAHD